MAPTVACCFEIFGGVLTPRAIARARTQAEILWPENFVYIYCPVGVRSIISSVLYFVSVPFRSYWEICA